MTQEQIISELLSIEAQAKMVEERAYRLRKSMSGVSTPGLSKGGDGLSQEQLDAIEMKVRKNTLRKRA